MFEFSTTLRVRYAETDQMGFVYYGNYAQYFEVARVEAFRHLGFSYKELEDSGILMPVSEYKSKYIKPAKYDDLLTIKVIVRNKPSVKIIFEYEVYNQQNTLLNISETTLVFVKALTGKLSTPPAIFETFLTNYF